MKDNQLDLGEAGVEEESPAFVLEDFEINIKDESKVLLGKGSFAAVYLSRCRRDGRLYALKVVCSKDRGRTKPQLRKRTRKHQARDSGAQKTDSL